MDVEEGRPHIFGLALADPIDVAQGGLGGRGRSRAISRSVVSWKITYGGTPRPRARRRRTSRRRSKRARSTPSHDSVSTRERRGPASFARRFCRNSASGVLARAVAHQRAALRREHQHRIVARRLPQIPERRELLDVATHLGERHAAEQTERAQLRMPARGHRLRRLADEHVATCAAPKRCSTRATHDSTFLAIVTASSTSSSSPRHTSQAPQSSRS